MTQRKRCVGLCQLSNVSTFAVLGPIRKIAGLSYRSFPETGDNATQLSEHTAVLVPAQQSIAPAQPPHSIRNCEGHPESSAWINTGRAS